MTTSTKENVLQWGKALKKAQAHQQDDTILDLLKQLKPIQVTRKLLQETQIGKDVNVLRKYESAGHPEKATRIKKEAKALVDQWRQAVDSTTSQSSTASSPVIHPGKTPESKVGAKKTTEKKLTKKSSPPPASKAAAETIKPTGETSTSKQTSENGGDDDDVVMPETGNHLRDKSIEMLYQALSTDASADSALILSRAEAIEKIVFGDHENKVEAPYKARIRTLFSNLKMKGNPSLRDAVVSGDLKVEKISRMSTQDMASEERKQKDLEIQQQNVFNARGAEDTQAETDQFKCNKCKQRRCKYYQMQTRSADEPMTTFVTCTNCNNRWRFC